jgi:hypothetical protein
MPYVQELEQKAELQSISEVIKKEGIGVPVNETAAPEESAVAARWRYPGARRFFRVLVVTRRSCVMCSVLVRQRQSETIVKFSFIL